ncbi:hypothetical protein [Acinetobacter baumannii]
MNAIKFIQEHKAEKAREVIDAAPSTATHFTEALGGHYAKEVLRNNEFQWAWFNTIAQAWYYDFESKERIQLSELRQLVESLELVGRLGGIDKCEGYAQVCFFKNRDKYGNRIKQAMRDYESIYGAKS